ncbi:sporulation protein YabP [Wansuia hejianensis]
MEAFCMEERLHRLTLSQRKEGTITGVVDVFSFDEHEILLKTSQGMLTVKGKELHVSRLELEKGEVDLEGQVDALLYTGQEPKQKQGSLLSRLFG